MGCAGVVRWERFGRTSERSGPAGAGGAAVTPGGGGGGGPDGPSRAGGPSFWARGCRGNRGGCVAQPALGTAFQKVSPATRRKRWTQGVAGRGLNSAMAAGRGAWKGPWDWRGPGALESVSWKCQLLPSPSLPSLTGHSFPLPSGP